MWPFLVACSTCSSPLRPLLLLWITVRSVNTPLLLFISVPSSASSTPHILYCFCTAVPGDRPVSSNYTENDVIIHSNKSLVASAKKKKTCHVENCIWPQSCCHSSAGLSTANADILFETHLSWDYSGNRKKSWISLDLISALYLTEIMCDNIRLQQLQTGLDLLSFKTWYW